jgi:hypothetical protein
LFRMSHHTIRSGRLLPLKPKIGSGYRATAKAVHGRNGPALPDSTENT